MTRPASIDHPLSVAEYLAREERSPVRHEYVGGAVYAMTGATLRHATIVGNVFAALRPAAGGGPCRVYASDVKVRAGADVFYYPDVVVHCMSVDDRDVYLREPCLVVEVASPGTRTTDRREKLLSYRALPSVRAYLMIEQRQRRVEAHVRDAAGAWTSVTVVGDDALALPCPATTLSLATIYADVALPALGEPEPDPYDPYDTHAPDTP